MWNVQRVNYQLVKSFMQTTFWVPVLQVMIRVFFSDNLVVSYTSFLFCAKPAKASCWGWLAGCQVPRPQPNHSTHPHQRKKKPLQSPPILKRSETYNGNFQGLYAQECPSTRPVPPPQTAPPFSLPSSLWPLLSPSAVNPKGQRAAGRWSAACWRWAESQTNSPPVWKYPPTNTNPFTSTQRCLRGP